MKKIVLLIYSSPFHFPPTINAANLLAEMGNEVHLLGIQQEDNWSQELDPKVKLVYLGPPQKGRKGIFSFFSSIIFLRRYLKNNRIDILLGYDAKSVLPAFAATRFTLTRWFFHQHDFWDNPKTAWQKFIWQTERRLLKYAAVVSFPQTERAEYFFSVARLAKMPDIVFNGPRKKWTQQANLPNPVIVQLRTKFDYLLIYQGGWSAFFGLDRIFDALAISKTNTALVMLGEEREPGIRQQYVNKIEGLGIGHRVYLAEKHIPYEELRSFTCFCDVAIAILTKDNDPAPFNNRYLIGASNKISEYIACGLPVLVQDSTPNRRFLNKYPIGSLINSTDPVAFAGVIDGLMSDNEKRARISRYNRELFQKEMNFDTQFGKIAARL